MKVFGAHEILQNESFNYHNFQIDSISYFVFFLLICMQAGNTKHLLCSRLSALDLFMLNQNALLTCQQNCLA